MLKVDTWVIVTGIKLYPKCAKQQDNLHLEAGITVSRPVTTSLRKGNCCHREPATTCSNLAREMRNKVTLSDHCP